MCELIGFSSRSPMDIRQQLREFFSHSEQHPHGWGLFHSGGLQREAVKAAASETLRHLLEGLPPQRLCMGHIRFATVGSIRTENCHPFTGLDAENRRWTLIHNGTVYSGRKLIGQMQRQTGDTDSERVFLYLLQCVNETRPKNAAERFALIERIVRELSPRNKLNLMLSDGELLYVHKNMEHTLYYRALGEGMLFATAPVDGGAWQSLPMAQLFAYRDGQCVFSGEPHKGIFVPTLQYITADDAMHI